MFAIQNSEKNTVLLTETKAQAVNLLNMMNDIAEITNDSKYVMILATPRDIQEYIAAHATPRDIQEYNAALANETH